MKPDEICYMIVNEDGNLAAMPDGMAVYQANEREHAEREAELISRHRGIAARVVKVDVDVGVFSMSYEVRDDR